MLPNANMRSDQTGNLRAGVALQQFPMLSGARRLIINVSPRQARPDMFLVGHSAFLAGISGQI
ncbi:hypothetical protein TH25_18440 [Thalassospira profundimaris]|uniref:Uncharacterized protein n=1 Tax=Thalassospira profundimaris TaxID=502049 RepID=A0A367WU21_9PROT|nr:hypothetical protein TH25_18440 [Thalassospira profundimaris]